MNILEAAVERALRNIREEQLSQPNQHDWLERELSLVETRLRHLVDAVARGDGSDAVFAGLRGMLGSESQIGAESIEEMRRLPRACSVNG